LKIEGDEKQMMMMDNFGVRADDGFAENVGGREASLRKFIL
jgi:hypothetical protein